MKLVEKIPLLIIAAFTYVVIYSSCASVGSPDGGPSDSLPPVLLKTVPLYHELNYKGNEVRLTFDEYIIYDKVMEELVVSPPLEKRPVVRIKSKTLIIQFNEELRDSTTYSMDFKNSIVDNNERNPFKNFRFSFSTGDVFDSLRVAGMVKNAFNLNPVEKALVLLQKNLHDSAVFRVRPDYIAKTDDQGIFMIDNIAPGKYHIFSINDANANLLYDEGAEEIAFIDTLIVPSAKFIEERDTIVSGADSLLISGHTQFMPGPVYLRQFTEDIFEQYLNTSKRESLYKCLFIFSESVKDTFGVRLLNYNAKDWYLLEPNQQNDSIVLWITDTLVAQLDTFDVEVSYNQLDSAGIVYVQNDTLSLPYTVKKKAAPKKKKNKDKEEKKIPQFTINSNIKTSGFDLNRNILLNMPEPVKTFYYDDMVRLYLDKDTTGTPLEYTFTKDTSAYRRFIIGYNWEPNTAYRLEVDSAAIENIYGITNKKLIKKFTTQKEEYYGKIIVALKNITCPLIVQLIKNTEEEEVLKQKFTSKDGDIMFDFLKPDKYIIKIIYDANDNHKWDAGSYQDHIQPEKVAYLQKVIKVKSNFEHQEPWDVTINPTYPKVLYDQELEEQKQKAKEKKQRQPKQQERNRNSNSFGGGGQQGLFN
ncbi:MAG: Ig-like domain-containing protein [Chlorobi bacterium]|nr:Ig-like domain-containing protein [Chlorobiota bacterium]